MAFEVMDQERFASLQETISAYEKQIAALEEAVSKLDSMGDVWFEDLEYRVGQARHTPIRERQEQAARSGALILRRSKTGLPPAAILDGDDEFKRFKARSDKTITDAEKQIAELGPKLAETKAILEGVGC